MAAQPGHHLAAAKFRVRAITLVDENANNNATVTGADEQAYTPSFALVAEGTNFANGAIRLQPGDSLIGWVTFELPDGVRVTKVQWAPASGLPHRPPSGWSLETRRAAHQIFLLQLRQRVEYDRTRHRGHLVGIVRCRDRPAYRAADRRNRQDLQGTYTARNGVIVGFNVRQVG